MQRPVTFRSETAVEPPLHLEAAHGHAVNEEEDRLKIHGGFCAQLRAIVLAHQNHRGFARRYPIASAALKCLARSHSGSAFPLCVSGVRGCGYPDCYCEIVESHHCSINHVNFSVSCGLTFPIRIIRNNLIFTSFTSAPAVCVSKKGTDPQGD